MLLAAVLLSTVVGLTAEETSPPHRVIVERKVELLEERLRSVARSGYRLLDASDGRGGFTRTSEFRLHLERVSEGSVPPEYRVVSGDYSGKLVHRLDDAGAEGFVVHPRGVLRKALPNPLGGEAPAQAETPVLILERDRAGPPRDYELIVPGKARQLDRELVDAAASGFSLAGLRAFQGGFVLAVLERPVTEQPPRARPTDGEPPFLTLDQRDREKLFRDVGAAAKRGYRIVTTVHQPFGSRGDAVLMSHDTSPGRPYSYYFLGRPPAEELEQRLEEGAEAGYRFRAGFDSGAELIMERAPLEERTVRYHTVDAESAAELERAVAEALAEGWAWSGLYGNMVVLEKNR